jgi:ubiquinone/menaquinone biosynthesis C-methylase UbiE
MIAINEQVEKGALDELGFHFAPQVVLFTALEVGIFPALAGGARSIPSIASATDCSPRGVRTLLNCLAAMGLVKKEDDIYDLNRYSRKYFLPSSEHDLTSLFLPWEDLFRLWLTLPEAVRTGRPSVILGSDQKQQRLNVRIAEALFQAHRVCAWRLVEICTRESSLWRPDREVLKILDVAAGSAVWSIPWALNYTHAEVTAIDFPPVLEVAKKYTKRFGVEQRYKFVASNIREIDFGIEEYDLALLGHICHSEGPTWSQRLIENCSRALKRTGRLLIMDYIADEERNSDLMPLLLALNALLGTEDGDTFTFSEYRKWLNQAGFEDVRTLQIDGHSPVVVGLKDGK